MKTIVTHISPDLDAITSIWLVKTFIPGWEEASLAFVSAGTTLGRLPPDDNPDIIHVDTGFGRFDHHQTSADTCASKLVYEEVVRVTGHPDEALRRMVELVNDVDHFKEVNYPNPTADFWDFSLTAQIDGWRHLHPDNPITVVNLGMSSLDAIYKAFTNKVWAEKEIREKGVEFMTRWGKAIGVETSNDDVIHLAQKKGYNVVVRKDPRKHYVRIKSLPKQEINLSTIYEKLKADEPDVTWFLHASGHMVLNGSAKNPDMKPSRKTLGQIIEVLKSH